MSVVEFARQKHEFVALAGQHVFVPSQDNTTGFSSSDLRLLAAEMERMDGDIPLLTWIPISVYDNAKKKPANVIFYAAENKSGSNWLSAAYNLNRLMSFREITHFMILPDPS